MECDVAQEWSDWDQDEVRQAVAPWVLDTYFEGQKWPTMLNSSSSVSMILSNLLPKELPAIHATCIAYLHGHTHLCRIVETSLLFRTATDHPGGQGQIAPVPCPIGQKSPSLQTSPGFICSMDKRRGGVPSLSGGAAHS